MYLLDTCVFIWFLEESCAGRLSDRARRIIEDPDQRIHVSVATPIEMAYLVERGRIELAMPLEEFVWQGIARNGFRMLSLEMEHAREMLRLPFHHRDPFDRILLAQARCLGCQIISSDAIFRRYGAKAVW